MPREYSKTFEREDHTEVEVFYHISAYDSGVCSGPAELCYPPEGGEVEITRVMANGEDLKWSDAEDEKWCEEIAETHVHDDYDYFDDGWD
jgi:hypothetical protein